MKFKHLFSLTLLMLLLSCNFKLMPAYNESTAQKVTVAFSGNMAIYDNAIKSPDKKFVTYQSDYDLIESQIHEIVSIEQARKNGKIPLGMANDVLERFLKYEGQHKTLGALNNSQLQSYKDYMQAYWKPLYNFELNLK